MALALSCSCGAAFEVEDTFAGQAIACPDCSAALKVPPLRPPRLRTSGYAVASVVLALVGAFTVIGTAVAAVLGIIALASIARHRDRLSGAGYAVLGIVLGVGLTLLTGLAFSRGEIFDRIREQATAGQVDMSGPMEIVRQDEGFAITRPSPAWGVATAEYAKELQVGDDLLLVNRGRNGFLEVSYLDAGAQTLDQYRDTFLDGYRDQRPAGQRKLGDIMGYTDFHLQETTRLPPLDGAEVAEARFDVKHAGQKLGLHVRFVKPRLGRGVYVMLAWAPRRYLEQIEPQVQHAMESFRLLADR